MKMTSNYSARMNGLKFSSLEFEEQAFIRKMIRIGLARIVDRRVQIRNASDTDYTISYEDAVNHAKTIRLDW